MYIYLIEEVKEAFTNDWTLKNLFSSATTVFHTNEVYAILDLQVKIVFPHIFKKLSDNCLQVM